jgi:sugar phosphate isomerase/epimerase
MRLNHGLHLAYCTNVHRGETWAETFAALERHTLAVKLAVSPDQPYAIGLRLSDAASRELAEPAQLQEFQHWLDRHCCYVFTINGFPFGQFHSTRVKEQVYWPDWTQRERLDYTCRLFDLLNQLLPPGMEGSVSTLPGSFKEFIGDASQEAAIRANLWSCVEHIGRLSESSGRSLHLGLEPEPLGWFENSVETVAFFDRLRDEHPNDPRLDAHLGVNYDTCHFAVEYEEPQDALARMRQHGVRISKFHLSNALTLTPTSAACEALSAFADDVYLHQVIARDRFGQLSRFKDLPEALGRHSVGENREGSEWRVHFHIPLHCEPAFGFCSTADHVRGVLGELAKDPGLCRHLELETYTWEVLPPPLKQQRVVDQLFCEYQWTLARLAEQGLAGARA